MFLPCIIPGPRNPREGSDVFLQLLIDGLHILKKPGVSTYNVLVKGNFLLRAALMWTMNNFAAYGILSSWSFSLPSLYGLYQSISAMTWW